MFAGLIIALLATSCTIINPSTSSQTNSSNSSSLISSSNTSSSSSISSTSVVSSSSSNSSNSSSLISSSSSSSSSANTNTNLTVESTAPNYYNDLAGLSGDNLSTSLSTLITTTHTTTTTYDQIRHMYKYSDLAPSGKMLTFYAHAEINGDWDGGISYNREHVWPQSLGWFKTNDAGADLHHVRPTLPSINSTRNNNPYGEVDKTKAKEVIENSYLGGYLYNGYFEPLDHSKGDVARILLYLNVRYDYEIAQNKKDILTVVESMDLLLKWNELDPVDDHEMLRNNYVFSVQGNRNPFIDHPEFVDMIYDKTYSGEGALLDKNGANGSLTVEQKVERVETAINSIGTITLDSENVILTAEKLYESLTSEEKALVNKDLVAKLTSARETYEKLVEEENNNQNQPDVEGLLARFDFGDKGDATHKDGTDQGTSKEYKVNSYTLKLTNMSKVFGGAYDAQGNSCLKLGTSKVVGSFSFTVDEGVNKVIINVAQYKANKTVVNINGKEYTISSASNDGEYEAIEIDTSTNKTINFTTVTGGVRCMINSIEFCK